MSAPGGPPRRRSPGSAGNPESASRAQSPHRPTEIRPFRPGHDDAAVLALVFDAFSDPTRDGSEEVDIVRRTWACRAHAERVEFVAVAAAGVIGHALAACGRLQGNDVAVGGVAPVSVAPAHQGAGIGSALVRAVVADAAERGWERLVVLGEPSYYGRFGFGPAARLGLSYAPVGPLDPHFQACALPGHATEPRGVFAYCWE